MTHRLWAWLLERRRLGCWLWSVVHCADDWWLTLPRGHCETKERGEKDGAQDLTITYARMLYGRGRCVIGTLSVVDLVRVLLPLIRKKCHDALLWLLKLHFTSRGCDVWCGEPSSLLQERAAMRLAAEVELDDRVLLRSRAKTGFKLLRAK